MDYAHEEKAEQMSTPAAPDFQAVVSHLFRLMDLKGSPAQAKSEAYTVSLGDTLQVELIGMQQGFLSLLSVVGALPEDADGASLRALLYANEFTFDHPPVSLGVDEKTGNVMLWVRQALAELDDKTVAALFERFTRMAELVQQWLASGGAKRGAPIGGMRKGSTSERLRARNTGSKG